MSFSSDVKAEIAGNIPSSKHCRAASLAALLGCIGRFEGGPEEGYVLFLYTDNREAVRKCFTLIHKAIRISSELCTVADIGRREQRGWIQTELPSDAVGKLAKMIRVCDSTGHLRGDRERKAASELLERRCCRRNYIGDLFLCSGSISDPRKEYHLEWGCSSREQASQLQEVILSFGIEAKVVLRKKLYVVYVKDSDGIVDLLNLMGAPVSMMEMENQRILKELRNSVNRRVNCEAANIGKTVSASGKQINDILFLEEKGILRRLPESLRKMAEIRLQYPDTPLRELGELAVPPIGKSGVNHRLRRLSEIAQKYRTDSADQSSETAQDVESADTRSEDSGNTGS